MSLKETKTYIEENYNIEFSKIWNDINDLIIKTFISINQIEIERENFFKFKSNNLFQLYGFDVIIDDKMKPWLLEVNGQPNLGIIEKSQKKLKSKLVIDMLNIVGMVPYSHIDGLAMDGECEYEDSVDEAVKQSICEFSRPLGGFERIFPLKDNIDYYKNFFNEISPNNQALWDEIKNNDEIEKSELKYKNIKEKNSEEYKEYMKNSNKKDVLTLKEKENDIKMEKEMKIIDSNIQIQNEKDTLTWKYSTNNENSEIISNSNSMKTQNENDIGNAMIEKNSNEPIINKYKNKINEEIIEERFPQFRNVSSQKLLMVAPSRYCKCNQKTVFFKYPSFIEQNIKNLNITELEIKEK